MEGVSDPSRSYDVPPVADSRTPLERMALESLVGGVSRDVPTERGTQGAPDSAVVLRLEELITDELGNVLVSVGDSLHTVILETNAHVTSRGVVASIDYELGGSNGEFTYLSFDVGMTVYVPADLDILLSAPND